MRSTLSEILGCLSGDRDARVEAYMGASDLAALQMDDAGQGEFFRVITSEEANELVSLGKVRDAR